ncbi:hypothetical protein [Variovorax sp. W2I14]|uniref:hypothetical protein n=1 Tax=Variovorax sp. W2I14 TaxID=3042290 RepID=UPI003D1E44A2
MTSRISQSDIVKLMGMMRPQKPAALPKIRVGGEGAGSYILPDDIEGLSAIVSIGAEQDAGFDRHFAVRGIQVYQYDPAAEKPETHGNLHFHRMGWAAENSADMVSLAEILARHALESSFDMVLKFNVGSTEWGALNSCTDELLSHFRIITAELHGLCLLAEPANLDLFLRRMALLTARHTPVHLHANNRAAFRIIEGVPVPDVVKLTLLRNDRDRFVPSLDPIPGPLDIPCASDLPDIVLRTF